MENFRETFVARATAAGPTERHIEGFLHFRTWPREAGPLWDIACDIMFGGLKGLESHKPGTPLVVEGGIYGTAYILNLWSCGLHEARGHYRNVGPKGGWIVVSFSFRDDLPHVAEDDTVFPMIECVTKRWCKKLPLKHLATMPAGYTVDDYTAQVA